MIAKQSGCVSSLRHYVFLHCVTCVCLSALVCVFVSACPRRPQEPEFKFGGGPAPGLRASADRLEVTRTRPGWGCAALEPLVRTAGRAYVEWVVEEDAGDCLVRLGVSSPPLAGEPPPPRGGTPCGGGGGCSGGDFGGGGDGVSYMYDLRGSRLLPGHVEWAAGARRCKRGRVGLLVHQGRVSVYGDGRRLGLLAEGLPPLVRFCVEMRDEGTRVRVAAFGGKAT